MADTHGISVEANDRKAAGQQAEEIIRSPAGLEIAKTFALGVATVDAAMVYSVEDRQRVLAQVSFALDNFYVHLPRKKSIYGFDPVRALALLRLRGEALTDGEFHESLVEILWPV